MPPEAIFDELDPVLTRWTMGGQSASLAPAAWRGALDGSDPAEGELRLLALTGQFLGLCVAPVPAGKLAALPDIPPLSLPLLPGNLAALARRCLKALKDSAGQRDVIHLLAARGYGVHPADWMPSRQEHDVPDAYAPWRDWAEGLAVPAVQVHDELTDGNWHEWLHAARRLALSRIRLADPARATALLAARADSEGADARLRLVECLIPGLSQADVPYLESLLADRAPKIRALAATLLARLGRGKGTGGGEDAAELAGFFEFQTKGLLRRTRILVPRPVKTPAQRSRRDALFAQVDFASLAAALDLPGEELAALWPFGGDRRADQVFAGFAQQSAPDPVFGALCERLLARPDCDLHTILPLLPRLDNAQRIAFAHRLLASPEGNFGQAQAVAGAGAGMDKLIETQPGRNLLGAAGGEADISGELRSLALVASSASADAALNRFMAAGLSASDPRLDLLRLNAALNSDGASA